jgi:hypothetical protein
MVCFNNHLWHSLLRGFKGGWLEDPPELTRLSQDYGRTPTSADSQGASVQLPHAKFSEFAAYAEDQESMTMI